MTKTLSRHSSRPRHTTYYLATTTALLLHCVLSVSSLSSPTPLATMTDPEPNPPVWPDSVKIVKASDDSATIMNMLRETQDSYNSKADTFTCDHHFSSRRWAVLFEPGVYKGIDLEVGYYVQVAGLGKTPDHVQFVDCEKGIHVPALNRHLHENGTCLDSFWRSGENFSSHASQGMKWAVSQAAPLRRVHVGTDLYLHDGAAYASGGHLANARVDGHTYSGGQQQYLMRNVEFQGGASGGAWGMVHVGCSGDVPASSAGTDTSAAVTIIETPKVRIEKPYVALKDDGVSFELRVPLPLFDAKATVGPLFDGSMEDARDFSRVRVVCADEPVSRIQEALDQGKDVVLAPGIFHLEKALELNTPDQVLLGLGLASLVAPKNGSPCIHVAPGVAGVRIASIMLEAAETDSTPASDNDKVTSLLEWGDQGVNDPGRKESPGALFDVFCRVGGATVGRRDAISVDTMVRIHSGNIVGDNLWLWRADHAELGANEEANYPNISPIFWQSERNEFRVETGIEVLGDDVTMYGLAVEHANGHQTVWSGERGAVHFFQCEFPYGVLRSFAEEGYRGYLIKDHVKEHEVYSPGIYSNFRNDDVVVSMALEHPTSPSIRVVNPFTVKLDNRGGIASIVNGNGGPALEQGIPVRITSMDDTSATTL